jgi:DNA-binding XRE family transcriptional regulator
MSRDFDELMHDIEAETRRAGPKAMREYAVLGAGYRLAVSIIELRRAAGLTQRQLAAKSGVQQADISRIEAGDANPTLATIAALAHALGGELRMVPADVDKGPSVRVAGTRKARARTAARRVGTKGASRRSGV